MLEFTDSCYQYGKSLYVYGNMEVMVLGYTSKKLLSNLGQIRSINGLSRL